jgi:hypothetical protein
MSETTITKGTRLLPDDLDAVDEYRRAQRPIPTMSDAIRTLIRRGLQATMEESGKAARK